MVMNPMAKARGLQLGRSACRVRLHDDSPADVLRSDGVRWASEPAGHAMERCLGVAVGLRYMPAGGAGARCVPRIYQDHGDPSQPSLILDEGAKLMERPIVLDATLSLANRYPFADTLQVLKGDSATGAFGLRNQPLADDVVHVTGEPSLLPAELLQEPLGGLGALGLQPRPQFGVALPQAVQVPAGVNFAVRVGGEVDDAEVNSEPVLRFVRGRFGNIHRYGEVEGAVAVDEIGLASNALEPSGLIAAEDDRDKLPSPERQDGHPVEALPGQHPLVIDDGSVRAEDRLLGLIPLVGFRDLADDANGHLRGQAKPSPDVIVDDLLEPNLVGGSRTEGDFGNDVAGCVKPFHRLQEGDRLIGCRLEFDRQRQVHGSSISRNRQYRKKGSRPSSPRLKAGASGRRSW